MPMVTPIDENYLIKVEDLHTPKELLEINQIPINSIEIGVWEPW